MEYMKKGSVTPRMNLNAPWYVGVTGFTTSNEIELASLVFKNEGFGYEEMYKPMYGFLVSEKRLGDIGVAGQKSPAAKDLAALARKAPDWTLPMMHYHTQNKETLCEQLSKLFGIDGMYESGACRAVQLNVDWPPIEQLERSLEKMPELQMVLQLPKRAMDGLTTAQIAERCQPYDGLVRYALIDASGGKGVELDVKRTADIMWELHDTMTRTSLGVAGGLNGDNVERIVGGIEIVHMLKDRERNINYDGEISGFSIDAQGQLRHECIANFLDFQKFLRYVQAAGRALFDADPVEFWGR